MSVLALREVRLYGALGERFGRVHRLAVATAAEAVRALCANFPGFEAALLEVAPGYRVRVGDRRLEVADEVRDPSGARERIAIIPVLAGAKSEFTRIILGVALIAASFFVPGLPALAANALIGLGASMVLGGVAQMLAPTPAQQAGADYENKPSYIFDGPTNTSAQGLPVPVGYGRLIVGSAVISAAITTEEFQAATVTTKPAGSAGSTGNGPYQSDPGYSYPQVPGDTTANSGTIENGWDLSSGPG